MFGLAASVAGPGVSSGVVAGECSDGDSSVSLLADGARFPSLVPDGLTVSDDDLAQAQEQARIAQQKVDSF